MKNYWIQSSKLAFKPSHFNIILMSSSGKFFKGSFGKGFSFSLINSQLTLPADTYCVMIDPVWNAFAEKDPAYKQIIMDIYMPQSTTIVPLDQQEGMRILANAAKQVALHRSPSELKKAYLPNDPDYKDSVTRIIDRETLACWYGFIYTQNMSAHTLDAEL